MPASFNSISYAKILDQRIFSFIFAPVLLNKLMKKGGGIRPYETLATSSVIDFTEKGAKSDRQLP